MIVLDATKTPLCKRMDHVSVILASTWTLRMLKHVFLVIPLASRVMEAKQQNALLANLVVI